MLHSVEVSLLDQTHGRKGPNARQKRTKCMAEKNGNEAGRPRENNQHTGLSLVQGCMYNKCIEVDFLDERVDVFVIFVEFSNFAS